MNPSLTRYWHTLRYLKPIQIFGRLKFKLLRPKPDLRPAPSLRPLMGIWQPPTRRAPSLLGPEQFCFLNETAELKNVGWDGPEMTKLWRYNQHYFDDLNALDSGTRTAWHHDLLRRWIHDNPPGKGIGWESYPAALRIVNWIKWSLEGNSLPPEYLHSLAIQTRWLLHRLELHLLGNHLLADAKALIFSGLFFEGDEPQSWLEKGLQILGEQIPEQILPDGGHFERSPMYHAIVLEDMLDLLNLSILFSKILPKTTVLKWENNVQRMRRWMAAMIHPDGEISFFNDATFGIAPNHSELEAYADRLNLPKMDVNHRGVTTLNDSGYIRIAKGEAVAFLDLAPIGPDYLPGHAHADTLSFELSLFGKRIFVNSGTSDYGNEVIRNYERSTAAHNTLELDGKNSSDVWGAFRVGRRAKVIKKEIIETESEIRISGSHNGYHHLQGNPLHERHWLLTSNKLIIHDIVKGVGGHNITNRLHVHPDYHIEKENHNIINIKSFNKDIVCSVYMNGGEIIFEESYYSYGFNLREKKIVICLINSLVNLSAEFLIEIYFNKK